MSATRGGPPGEEERREFFRIDDCVVLEYQEISGIEADSVLDRLENELPDRFTAPATFAATSRQMHQLLHSVRALSPELGRYLEALDGKLNMLARLFLVEELHAPEQPGRQVNISAGGMAFRARTPQQPGDLLELKLVLFPSYLGILSVGRVVYCERRPGDDPDFPWHLAVEFSHLRDSDQELLIKYLLNRQTEQRRRPSGSDPDN